MAGFVWSEQMSVGVPALDADHRCLVRLVNLLRDIEGEDARRAVETCSIRSSSIAATTSPAKNG
jgi:hemerythrin